MRKSGILLPVSSLASGHGIGAFSKEAYEFVDFLEAAGQKFWQILPLGPTGYGDSPYQSFSTFAGNPYFIDLEDLIRRGWLGRKICDACDFGGHEESIDYEKLYHSRFQVLYEAYKNSDILRDVEFQEFVKENQYWLDDYALYMAVKNSFGGKSFILWSERIKLRDKEEMDKYREKYEDQMIFYMFQQYMFAIQWRALKSYANKKGIQIIGDIPIYVALDSADTWANPQLFQLDKECVPLGVSGCPPDAFSLTGQLWGNPLYRWEYHRETGYAWWLRRMAYCYLLYDVVRIDHFRGFDEYYFIPYGDETAENGHWETGPGYDIFRAFKEKFGKIRVIAEDLGYLTPSVIRLVKKTGYPGMKVLQFAFDGNEKNAYLPHNHVKNSVVYTGTHDNDTIIGWYLSLSRKEKLYFKNYLNLKSGREVHQVLIRLGLSSVADTCIVPMQDYLGLGSEARTNFPSTVGDNWKWRMKKGVCTKALAEKIYAMARLYDRC